MPRCDTLYLEILTSIPGKLQYFCSQVLQYCCCVDGCSCTHPPICCNPGLQQTVDTTHRELETSTGRTRNGCFLVFVLVSSRRFPCNQTLGSFSRHFSLFIWLIQWGFCFPLKRTRTLFSELRFGGNPFDSGDWRGRRSEKMYRANRCSRRD
uniref:Uncharacterized protein n=1 Tax=Opuntia streptacantha TaxID=393608 RepID=A0A7C9CNR8_OPUST